MENTLSKKRGSLSLGPTEHQAYAKRPAVQAATRSRALEALKLTYGFDTFRGKQEEAVLAAIAGRDVLVIMPTGGGKTVCYVIPALVQPGVCIVVSPLLALMQDQVANLTKLGIRVAQLSSALPAAQRTAVMRCLWSGSGATGNGGGAGCGCQPRLKLLLVTPELLVASSKFRALLQRLHSQRDLSLFAIDEAHCISTWGHDFRPAYRQLQRLRRDFPGVPIMALTATAASKVRDDICDQLWLHNPVRLLSSFNRPNISYAVRYLDAEELDEVEALVRLLSVGHTTGAGGAGKGSGRGGDGGTASCSIVYCQKRETCEVVAAELRERGILAQAYHGKMNEGVKKEVLRRWQADEVPVVVATIAFGMGIDKAAVRLVVHLNMPRSLEGFYQEAGRAGRDGLPAESVVLYSRAARKRMDYVLRKEHEVSTQGKRSNQVQVKFPSQGTWKGGGAEGSAEEGADYEEEAAEAAAATASKEEEVQIKTTAWQSFGQVVDWVMTAGCRRRALLEHFGEETAEGRCGGTGDGLSAGCDFCRNPQRVRDEVEAQKMKEREEEMRRAGGGVAGAGKCEDEEDMFAVRGGVGADFENLGGAGGDENLEAGPSFHQPGRRSSPADNAQVAEAKAAAALARAAAGGQVNDIYFAELAAREREHQRRQGGSGPGDVVELMLAASSFGSSGRSNPGTSAPPDHSTRVTATGKLAAALAASPAGSDVDPALLQQCAAAVEVNVFNSGLPRQLYTSRLAGLLSRVKAAQSVLVLLPQPPQPGAPKSGLPYPPDSAHSLPSSPAAPHTVLSAAATALLPSLVQVEMSAIEALLISAAEQPPAASVPLPTAAAATVWKRAGGVGSSSSNQCGGGSSSSPISRAVARLRALAGVAVTKEAVQAGNVGRRVNKLGKHVSPEVAEAARNVVASWKRQLPEGGKQPQPQRPQSSQ